MTTPLRSEKPQTSLTQDLLPTIRYYLGSRRGVMVLAGIAIVGGLTFNWNWLVAAGIAPILISVLPCAAICAIGVCCLKKTSRPASSTKTTDIIPSETGSGKKD